MGDVVVLPDDLERLGVIFVDGGSPACKALKRLCTQGRPVRPGEIFPVSREELDSLRKDTLIVDFPKVANG